MRTIPIIAASVILTVLSITPAFAEKPARTIKVSAQSELKVVPDEIVLDVAVETQDPELIKAKSENDRRTAAVLSYLKGLELDSKDYQIASVAMNPVYQREYGPRTVDQLRGYTFERAVEVRLHDFSKLEPVLSALVERGANHVRGLYFRTNRHREHQFEARRLAVVFANEKATHLAELNGLKLGKAIHIQEDVEGDWRTGGFGGSFGAAAEPPARPEDPPVKFASFLQKQQEKDPPAAAAEVPSAPGHLLVKATVTITFELAEPSDP